MAKEARANKNREKATSIWALSTVIKCVYGVYKIKRKSDFNAAELATTTFHQNKKVPAKRRKKKHNEDRRREKEPTATTTTTTMMIKKHARFKRITNQNE